MLFLGRFPGHFAEEDYIYAKQLLNLSLTQREEDIGDSLKLPLPKEDPVDSIWFDRYFDATGVNGGSGLYIRNTFPCERSVWQNL